MKRYAVANPLSLIRNSRFLRHVALLGSGTAIAQVANIAATPILATLYDPASFGTMAIYMGIVLIVGTMASFTYESAILLPQGDDEALFLLQLCLLLTTATSVFVLLILVFLHVFPGDGDLLSHWSLLILIPLGVLSLGAFNVGSQWSIRQDLFKNVSIASILRSTGALTVQILAGLLGATVAGLVLGRIAGQCAASIFVFSSCHLSFKALVPRCFASIRRAAFGHFRFPLFKAPQSVIVLLSDQMPAFALAIAFGPASAGLYWMADRILTLPSTIISEATAKTFYRECVRRRQNGTAMKSLFFATIACLFLAAFIPAIVIFNYAPALFGMLGGEWEISGYYAQWLIIWALCKFSFSPVMAIYMITDQQLRLLKIDTIAIVCRGVIFSICFFVDDPLHFVMIVCIFESMKILLTVADIIVVLRQFEGFLGSHPLVPSKEAC